MASRRRITTSPSQTLGWRRFRRQTARFLLRASGWELRGLPAPHFQNLTFYLIHHQTVSLKWAHLLLRACLARKVQVLSRNQPAPHASVGWEWQYLDGSDSDFPPLESSLHRAQKAGNWISVILVDPRRKKIDIHTPFLCSHHPDRASFYIRRALRYMHY